MCEIFIDIDGIPSFIPTVPMSVSISSNIEMIHNCKEDLISLFPVKYWGDSSTSPNFTLSASCTIAKAKVSTLRPSPLDSKKISKNFMKPVRYIMLALVK